MTIPAAIIGEAVLSFLGLGVQPPTPSWGVMLSDAQSYLSRGAPARDLPGPGDLLLLALVQPARRRPARRPRPADAALISSRCSRCATSRCTSRPTTGTVHAVDRMSASRSAPGEVLGLVGESGCGKSVTRDVASPTAARDGGRSAGTAVFDGVDLLAAPARSCSGRIRGREIAFVFQEPMTSLNPAFTVGDQIAEVLREHLGPRPRGAPASARSSCSTSSASRRLSAASTSTRTSSPAACASA